MSTEHPDIRALEREWKIGLFVVIGGFTLAIAIAAFLTFGKKPHAVVPDQTQVAEPAPPSGDAANGLNDPSQVCSTALANAKNFGVLPMTGHLRDPDPRQTDQEGRYICDAETGSANYSIAVDIVCDDATKESCISIYNVAEDDGAVLYQRQN
ncbi:MAG TPA: hypothetical protein VHD95_02160 [Rhizomicrobium sp.]|jgi:hypothetical protein|nr:hypothetical protein [Rhizomicrobium sp.]